MTLKIAFTGAGHMSRVHAWAAGSLAELESVAIVKHRPESIADFAAQFGIGRQYGSVEALLGAV